MVDGTVLEQLDEIEIVADQMFDEGTRGPCLGVRLVFQPVVRHRRQDVPEECALMLEKAFEEGRCAHP